MDDDTSQSDKLTVDMDGKMKMESLNGYKKIILTKKGLMKWMKKAAMYKL